MTGAAAAPLRIALPSGASVSGLIDAPADARAVYVFAHGAGAGMSHAFMSTVAQGLARRGMATLRFQFPFMEQGSRRPDPPAAAHAAVRAAVLEASRRWPQLPLFAGGKSYGARMTSQAQAAQLLPGVLGLVFLGFPLHPAGKPGTERAQHLAGVDLPLLFLQGTRDALAELTLVQKTVQRLGARATLHLQDGADHAFHVLARSGRTDAQVSEQMLDVMLEWTARLMPAGCASA